MRRILALTASLAALAACGGSGGGEAEPPPKPSATTTAATGDLEIYEVPSAGFSVGVPADWNAGSVDELRESDALQQAAEENPSLAPFFEALRQPNTVMKFLAGAPEARSGFVTNMNVIVEELPAGMERGAYESANLANIRRGLEVEGQLAEERVELPAGEALRVEYRHSASQAAPNGFVAVQYVFVEDDAGYVLTFTTTPDALPDYASDFEESARSFRLL